MIARRICLQFAAALLIAAACPRVTLAQDQGLTAAYNASGQGLFQQFAAKPGNIVFSPYSIGTAMAMALAGARGPTEQEMLSVLQHTMPRPQIDAANGRLVAILNSYDKSADAPQCPPGMKADGKQCKGPRAANRNCLYPMRADGDQCVGPATFAPSAKLAVANSLMLTKAGENVSPDYIALLKSQYGAEVFRNAQLADVNNWVKGKTEGKIEKILEQLDTRAPAVLLNAVYFKASWLSVFNKRDTSPEDFNLTATDKARVPMMHKTATYGVASQPGFKAIVLPYAVRSLNMIVVVPDAVDGANEIGARLDAGKLAALKPEYRSKRVELAMPRFKASFSADLIPAFSAAGMKLAFSDAADFSGITGAPNAEAGLKIGAIAHKAVIEVEEEGTEAAAATAIVMMPTSAMPQAEPERFRVDRPFLFYIVEETSGAVLFQGRINDPR